jgi:hypothetical protein
MGCKKVRLYNGPGTKLLRRFYEPLVLLHVLDPNGEERILHALEHTDTVNMQLCELRRTFLNQLAYVCDYITGGDTVTAIALEAQPSGVIFWVTSNTEVSPATRLFLHGILTTLQSLGFSQTDDSTVTAEAEIAQRCIEFNIRRVKTYQTFMRRSLDQCLVALRCSGKPAGERLQSIILAEKS